MGAFQVLITNVDSQIFNQRSIMSIQQSMNLKTFGIDWSDIQNIVSPRIDSLHPDPKMNTRILEKTLSRQEIASYKQKLVSTIVHQKCINDLTANCRQPFEYPTNRNNAKKSGPTTFLFATGEIYNYSEIVQNADIQNSLVSTSDVEIFLHLYKKNDNFDFLKDLDGQFTFLIIENLNNIDSKTWNIFSGRDIFGIRNLYILTNKNNDFILTSNLLSIENKMFNFLPDVQTIKPGYYWSFKTNTQIPYWDKDKFINDIQIIHNSTQLQSLNLLFSEINTVFTESIISRFKNSLKPICILFSSGLVSTIILHVILNFMKNNTDYDNKIKILYHSRNNRDVFDYQSFFSKIEKKYNTTIDKKIVKSDNSFEHDMKDILKDTKEQIFISGFGLKQMFCHDINYIFDLHKTYLDDYDEIAGLTDSEFRFPFLNLKVIKLLYSISDNLKKPIPVACESGTFMEDKFIIRKSFLEFLQ